MAGFVDRPDRQYRGRYEPYRGDYRQPAPPPPRKKSSKGKYVLVAVGIFVLLGACGALIGSGGNGPTEGVAAQTAGTSAAQPSAGQAPPAAAGIEHAEDVQITSCGVDAIGWAEAGVVVINNSSKTSNYIITIVFESGDGTQQVGTGIVAVNNLTSGQRSEQTTSALEDGIPGMVCKVSEITRYAS